MMGGGGGRGDNYAKFIKRGCRKGFAVFKGQSLLRGRFERIKGARK